jgi:hypothetical protein
MMQDGRVALRLWGAQASTGARTCSVATLTSNCNLGASAATGQHGIQLLLWERVALKLMQLRSRLLRWRSQWRWCRVGGPLAAVKASTGYRA